jgi:putative DNA methylase
MHPIKSPRKLIEVALPLDRINEAAKHEKTVRHGHPGNLHRWWARRPLAAARAVLFAQTVNDPGFQQGGGFKYGKNKKEAAQERKRLFRIMEELVLWENTNNERVLEEARAEIERSWREVCELNRDHPDAATLFNPDQMPGMHDPFAGGGTIPLEAQRLGFEAFASDLNPVAVLINKAMIEIPAKFAGNPPVWSASTLGDSEILYAQEWPDNSGLAEDVRRYATWMLEEAKKRVGHLYPVVEITSELAKGRPDLKQLVGQKVTVINWLWARTIASPNPAFQHVNVPLISSYILTNKAGKETYIEPIVEGDKYEFSIRVGVPPEGLATGTKLSRGANFQCLVSGVPIEGDHIKSEGKAGRMGARLMAIVAEGKRGRIYLPPTKEIEELALNVNPNWVPNLKISGSTQYLGVKPYGMDEFSQLFTNRQLLVLTTFSDLVQEAIELCYKHAKLNPWSQDESGLNDGGNGPRAYAEAIGVYLAIALSKTTDSNNSLCPWEPVAQCSRQLFGRQAIPMLWDFAEANPIHDSSGGFWTNIEVSLRSFKSFSPGLKNGHAQQEDAARQSTSAGKIISTDPPYYDNVPYADLSDFFYVWLRRSLKSIFPDLFSTMAVPKVEELVAFAYRHGGKPGAESFFLNGMTQVMHRLAEQAHPAFPVTIYYAFRQSDTEGDGGDTASTGWETFLESIIRAGFAIGGTWPMRTESVVALKNKRNALASSILLVCTRRHEQAGTISRREFIRELNIVLPDALDEMTRGTGDDKTAVAPVDLSQAIIGPGMAIFSRYASVIEADGSPMSVRTALQLINRYLAEDDFDPDTRFCIHWFEQYGWKTGEFGQADVLARSKSTSVDGLVQAGVAEAGGGSVRLLKWGEYPNKWDPRTDTRLPVWEALHHLIRILKQSGESAAGAVVAAIPGKMEAVRQLAYRLYTLCERQNWAEDARAYNELITSWSGIESASPIQPSHQNLFD